MQSRIASITLIVAVTLGAAAPVRAANVLEKNFWLSGPRYERNIPGCDFPAAVNSVIDGFKDKEARFWNSALGIVSIDNIRETAELAWAAQSIPRRFCAGTALISDGIKRPIYYSIAEDTWSIGADWGVEFCVVGLDRNSAYGPACRAARR
jgi:hypothetical protein